MDEKVLLDVQVNAQDALDAYGKLKNQIASLRKEQEQLADENQKGSKL